MGLTTSCEAIERQASAGPYDSDPLDSKAKRGKPESSPILKVTPEACEHGGNDTASRVAQATKKRGQHAVVDETPKKKRQKSSGKPPGRPASAKKATLKEKNPAKKTPAKKTPAKEAPAEEAPAEEAPAKEAPAKEAPAKKTPAKKTPAKKTPAKKTPAKKTPAKKTPAKKTPAKSKDAPTTPAPAADSDLSTTPPPVQTSTPVNAHRAKILVAKQALAAIKPGTRIFIKSGEGNGGDTWWDSGVIQKIHERGKPFEVAWNDINNRGEEVDTDGERRIGLPVTYSLAGVAADAISAVPTGTEAAALARKSVLAKARIGSWCISHPEEPWGMLDPFGEDCSTVREAL